MEEIETWCRERLIANFVLLKESELGWARLKTWDKDRYTERRMPTAELVDTLTTSCARIGASDYHHAEAAASSRTVVGGERLPFFFFCLPCGFFFFFFVFIYLFTFSRRHLAARLATRRSGLDCCVFFF